VSAAPPAAPASGTRTPRREDARSLALRVLQRVEESGAYADLALHAALARSRLDPRDRAFATELVYGTLRFRGRLDFLLAHVTGRPLARLEHGIVQVLRLGAYQLVFCDRVPDAAAVSESVRLAHAAGMGRAAGLVNASLRRLARDHAAIALPALADDPIAHLVHTLSFPQWLAERWVAQLGADEAAALATALNETPPRTLRANRLRVDRAALLAELLPRFPLAAACRFAPDGVTLGRRGDPAGDPAFQQGRMTVQDEASQLVVEVLDPQPGERVLDACAAPGAKATAIAERVGASGEVVALDRNERRLGLVARDALRLGLENLRTLVADASAAEIPGLDARPFDRILVDAPCSGLGALRRNPDARWRVQPEAIAQLAAVQRAILAAVSKRLRPGGTLVYSTCTLSPEENDDVVEWLLAHTPELRRAPESALPPSLRPLVGGDAVLRCWPQHHDTDGFFAARLERRS
jgi:16S rRNA (cytosine967-C5)-methyltransferase